MLRTIIVCPANWGTHAANCRAFRGNFLCLRNDGSGGRRGWSSLPRTSKSRFSYPEGMVAHEDDYLDEAQYPEIDEETHQFSKYQKDKHQTMLSWHQTIRDQPNPEAKTLEINMPRGYGYRCSILNEERFEYASESVYKFLTRSHLIENELPDVYSSPELIKEAKHYAEKLREPILEALNFESNHQSRSYDGDLEQTTKSIDLKRSQSIVTQINRVILSVLGGEVDHLSNCQVDLSPKIEAFWLMGGQQPTNRMRESRLKLQKSKFRKCKKNEYDPIETPFQYKGSPLLQLRCENPVNNFVDANSPHCTLPPNTPLVFPYQLSNYGIGQVKYNFASLVPGTWASDNHRCSHIAFHPRHHLLDEAVQSSEYWVADRENSLASQAILTSFGRLLAQALYFGFDQFTELNYPFSSQTIITDGLKWTFSAYQLNTIRLAALHLHKNPRQNICWKMNSMNIFEDAELKTINMTTLETILKFYLNKPKQIAVENPTPYLKSPLSTWDDETRKEIVFHNYRDMVSQRWYVVNYRRRMYPEVYEWENIYKIRHQQRFFEPRRRFFELPLDFPGRYPYDKPYGLIDPHFVGKRMKFLMNELDANKEKERIEEAKRTQSSVYEVEDDPKEKRRK